MGRILLVALAITAAAEANEEVLRSAVDSYLG